MFKSFLKFYDPAPGEGGGSEDKFEVLGSIDLSKLPVGEEDVVEDKVEDKAEDKVEDTKPTETKEPAKEAAKTEDKPAVTEDKPEVKADENKEPEKEVSLEEVLKGKDKRTVLKALGVSEEVYDALEAASSLSELKTFLDTRTKNWDDVPPQEILRESLRREYADLDDAKFEKVFKAELKKYDLESFDEDDKELGQIRLERDAKKIRDQFKKEQPEFQLPERKQSPEAQELAAIRSAQETAKTEFDSFVEGINSAPATKRLQQDKRIVLADGYKFDVDPEEIKAAVIDNSKLFEKCVDEKGNYDLEKVFKIIAFARNMDKVEAAYGAHYRSKVNEEELEELQNVGKRETAGSISVDETEAKAFASRGVHTTLGSILNL